MNLSGSKDTPLTTGAKRHVGADKKWIFQTLKEEKKKRLVTFDIWLPGKVQILFM